MVTLYQLVHDALHGKSGQAKSLKLQYLRTDKESVLGWVRTFSYRQEGSHTFSDLDNSTFRTLRYALPNVTQERSYWSSECGGEVGEKGRKQAVPQGRTRVLGFRIFAIAPKTRVFAIHFALCETAYVAAHGSKCFRN